MCEGGRETTLPPQKKNFFCWGSGSNPGPTVASRTVYHYAIAARIGHRETAIKERRSEAVMGMSHLSRYY